MGDEVRQRLVQRIKDGPLLIAPGVFDGISAKLAERAGCEALYMTGYGTVASALALPDAGLASFTEMLDRVQLLASATSLPLVADADTGYGGLLNIRRTVRGYEAAGAAAIQIEDQEFPKKCGHTPGRRVIPAADMAKKIEVAVDSRSSADFLVIARTDARTSLGLDEALRRGEAYARAGADMLFIEAPETEEEMRVIGRSFDTPLLINLVEGGRTPIPSPDVLQEMGFRLAIFPATGFLAMGRALSDAYSRLCRGLPAQAGSLYEFPEFHRLMGFEDVWAFERRFAQTERS